ncbi:MAG: DUF4349 domain-containing protein, partial [Bacteroidota bacterium]
MKPSIAIGCLLLLTTACGTYRSASLPPPSGIDRGQILAETGDGDSTPSIERRRLIYAASLELTAPEPDSVVNRIITLAAEYGGNIVATEGQRATIRVPAARFADALAEIETFGKLKDKNITGQDVTDEYHDYAIRLDNAERSRQRYLELLALAKNVEEAVTVERELERLNETIDLLKGQLNRLEQMEAYSTISVWVNRKAKLGPLGAVCKGLYAGVR